MSTKTAMRVPQFGRRNLYFHGMIHPRSRSPIGCVVRELTSVGAKLVVAPSTRLPNRFRLIVEAKGIDIDCDVTALGEGGVDVRFWNSES
jgi:hypothetical protein